MLFHKWSVARDRVPGKPAATVTLLLLICATNIWKNMIKVRAVSAKTHLSGVDLNFCIHQLENGKQKKAVVTGVHRSGR